MPLRSQGTWGPILKNMGESKAFKKCFLEKLRDTKSPSLFYTCKETPAGLPILICSKKPQGFWVPLTCFLVSPEPLAGKFKPERRLRIGFSGDFSVNQLLTLET